MRLTHRPATAEDVESLGEAQEKMAGVFLEGFSWSVFHGDELMFIVGHVPFWVGTTTVWLHVKEGALLPPRETIRICNRLIDIYTSSYRRVQAFVDSNSVVNNKFVKVLGFEQESVMAEGNPNGGDYNIYRRL
ncbi:acetyltransferase [Alteromonas phage ZP6]|uniref:Putative acetyltransferase n=1 Tax=Alteromonas phage ZP6 TaxID=2492447 RepID=A0A3S9U8B4_9CAUD|nr:acetyltransferase [Alteromonas phage ZP6]AZS06562.1 acetyltransferase [Alteromonas phage ZP6]